MPLFASGAQPRRTMLDSLLCWAMSEFTRTVHPHFATCGQHTPFRGWNSCQWCTILLQAVLKGIVEVCIEQLHSPDDDDNDSDDSDDSAGGGGGAGAAASPEAKTKVSCPPYASFTLMASPYIH